MYYIVAIIGAIIRQYFLPNPYEVFFTSEAWAMLFNMIIGGLILHVLSFTITGTYYNRGDAPVIGSISYLFWYCINTAIIIFIGTHVANVYLSLVLLLIIYIVIYSSLIFHNNKN